MTFHFESDLSACLMNSFSQFYDGSKMEVENDLAFHAELQMHHCYVSLCSMTNWLKNFVIVEMPPLMVYF